MGLNVLKTNAGNKHLEFCHRRHQTNPLKSVKMSLDCIDSLFMILIDFPALKRHSVSHAVSQ